MTCRSARAAMGLQEIGLPYAADAAITQAPGTIPAPAGVAAEHGSVRRGASGLACPTHMLFNGGVLALRSSASGFLKLWMAG